MIRPREFLQALDAAFGRAHIVIPQSAAGARFSQHRLCGPVLIARGDIPQRRGERTCKGKSGDSVVPTYVYETTGTPGEAPLNSSKAFDKPLRVDPNRRSRSSRYLGGFGVLVRADRPVLRSVRSAHIRDVMIARATWPPGCLRSPS
jgi:hypothetical protein